MSTTVFHDTTAQRDVKVFPLSLAQEGLWILDQLQPDRALNTLSATVHVKQALSIQALACSLNTLVQRHAALRTTFQVREGQLLQVITPSLSIPLSLIDLQGFEAQQEAEVLRLVSEETRRPFDLIQGPLMRACLLQLGAEEHILLLSIHHLVGDRWSLGICLHELISLYEIFSSGQFSPLPELPLSYADVTLQQQAWLKGDTAAEQLSYWKQQLAGSPAGINLPTDRPRLQQPTFRGATYDLTLPRVLSEALKALSQREGVDLDIMLTTAFQTLLHRYSGQEDLLIGIITAGRTRAESETVVGLFENILVLRTHLSSDLPFCELLEQVREVILQARVHQELPFEYLVKELHPTHAVGLHPFIQVMVTLVPPLVTLPPGWVVTRMEVGSGTSRYDLSLTIEERVEGLLTRFEYTTDLFDEATIARLAGHWQTLLAGIVSNPNLSLSILPLLTEQECQQLLVEWNTTQTDSQEDLCVHQIFEQQVERTPDAVALVFEDETLTYAELNRRANQLAHHLQRLGIGPDRLVGICMERSIEMVVGLLAVLKAGGAYVPLDPAYPAERLAFMVADAHLFVLLTQQRLHLSISQVHTILIEQVWQRLASEPDHNPISSVSPQNLAYVIYTSGSTGVPKGVLVPHANVHRLFTMTQAWFHFQAQDVWTLFHSITFDFSVWEIWGALLHGGRLVIVPYWVSRSPDAFSRLLTDQQVTVLNQTPSAFRMLMQVEETDQPLQDLALRLVIFGGEALDLQSLHPWISRHGDEQPRLINMYGITETTVHVTYRSLSQADLMRDAGSLIGRAIADLDLYILDAHQRLVPIGVAGELYVGGRGLARGYLNRPDLTAERFVPHLWSQQPGARLYRTGDLVRYRCNGDIEYLGRVDQQVKIRGYRIELGEIEATLMRHPAVREAVVLAREDIPAGKRLVAYLVLSGEQRLTMSDVRSYLHDRLPSYMIPSAFVFLDALPLTPNGKVNRRALPAPEPDRGVIEESYIAPRLSVEQQLVDIWEDLVKTRPIGIKDDFFERGGDSLLAVQMFDRIAQVCGKRLPLSTLFAGATIEHLARVLVGESTAELPEERKIDGRASVVVVREQGSLPPFFYLHGEWKGTGLYSRGLAHHLSPEQPFYLLEPYKFEGLAVPPTFEEVAAAHLEAIRRIQTEGPYFLSGYCNGALLAYEMARQLHTQGQKVGLLLLMDPDAPARHRLASSIIRRIGKVLQVGQEKQFEWFLSLQHVYRYLRFAHYRSSTHAKLLGSIKQGKPGGKESEARAVSLSLRFKALLPRVKTLRQDWSNIYDWQVSNYAPDLYPGKITFFWTSEEPWFADRWQKVMKAKEGEIEIYMNPGNHISGRTEYLPVLAQRLHECLDKAQATMES